MSNIKMKTRFDPGVVFMFYSKNGVKKLPSKNHPYGRCISPSKNLKCSTMRAVSHRSLGVAPEGLHRTAILCNPLDPCHVSTSVPL